MVQNKFLVHALITTGMMLLLGGCKKDAPFSSTPEISFIRMYPDTVKAFADSIVFEIAYADGDGDIGENNAYKQNLFLVDQRNQLEYGFRIGRIVADGSPAIRGTLKIVMPYINRISSQGAETTTFSIRLEDQAGNKSNVVSSSALMITE